MIYKWRFLAEHSSARTSIFVIIHHINSIVSDRERRLKVYQMKWRAKEEVVIVEMWKKEQKDKKWNIH